MSGSPASGDDSASTRLRVELGARGYDIVIGSGLIDDAAAWLAPVLNDLRVFVVCDANVHDAHGRRLVAALRAGGIAGEVAVVPGGEASKSFANLEALLERMIAARIERRDPIVALGGGVIGDLAGLAAALLRRGAPVVHIPTTLLAQVDSSVGGKTAINSRHGKNLVGAFHQPALVLCDTDVLASLPDREMRAGYAEIVKYGALASATFFEWLERHGGAVLARDDGALREAIARSCRIKAGIVAEDEREQGRRALLNLGHTFGHAIEALAGYDGRVLHGEAVAIGMVMAAEMSCDMQWLERASADRLRGHLAARGLPIHPRELGLDRIDAEGMLHHMAQDKKVERGWMTLVLLQALGAARLSRQVPASTIRPTLERVLAAP